MRTERLLGTARMTDMTLAGRILPAPYVVKHNLVRYVVEEGFALD